MKKESKNDKQIREYMNRIIDHELDKPNTNMNLVNAYSAILDYKEKGDSRYELDPDVKKEEINKLRKAYRDAYRTKQQQKQGVPIIHKGALKVCSLVCAIIILVSIPVCAISALNGISPVELLSNFGKAIFQWNVDKPVEVNGMTFIKNGKTRQYANIEECLRLENLDIYYPTWLPDGVYVESVIVSTSTGTNTITLKLSTETILFGIYASTSEKDEYIKEDFDKIEIDGIVAYYIKRDGKYYTKIELDGYIYTLTTPNIDVMKALVSGLTKE